LNKAVKLSKLEQLLARIRTRAAEPRRAPAQVTASAAAPVVAAPVVAAPVVAAPFNPSPAVATRVAAPPVVAVPVVPPPVVAKPAVSPPVAAPPVAAVPVVVRAEPVRLAPAAEPSVIVHDDLIDETTLPPPALGGDEFAVEVDMSEASGPPDALEASAEDLDTRGPSASQERLAIADSTPPPSIPPREGAAGPTPIAPMNALTDDESLPDDEDEDDDEAPVSSRRAVVSSPPEERLAQLAFGSEEPPQRHTPPPKSGPLPAPPVVEFEADITGVRKAETLSDEGSPRSAPSVLVPQAIRPHLASSENVVDVIGEAQSFSPKTFVALLDASLAL
jgi:hypothetical protein